MMSSAAVLTELEHHGPYASYHDLEVAIRDVFRRHAAELPAHYTSRDFLEWAIGTGAIVQKGQRFTVRLTVTA
jgi:hypothetical protein